VKRWPAFRAWPRKGVENLGELTPYYAKKLVSVRKWRMSYAHTYWKAPVLKVDFHLLQKPVSPSELRTKIGETLGMGEHREAVSMCLKRLCCPAFVYEIKFRQCRISVALPSGG
jgi:hypothetical protein